MTTTKQEKQETANRKKKNANHPHPSTIETNLIEKHAQKLFNLVLHKVDLYCR